MKTYSHVRRFFLFKIWWLDRGIPASKLNRRDQLSYGTWTWDGKIKEHRYKPEIPDWFRDQPSGLNYREIK